MTLAERGAEAVTHLDEQLWICRVCDCRVRARDADCDAAQQVAQATCEAAPEESKAGVVVAWAVEGLDGRRGGEFCRVDDRGDDAARE